MIVRSATRASVRARIVRDPGDGSIPRDHVVDDPLLHLDGLPPAPCDLCKPGAGVGRIRYAGYVADLLQGLDEDPG